MSQIPQKSLRILLKAVFLFVIFNYAFHFVPDSALWKVSLYNTILPGKTRFPLEGDLNLIFNAHEIANSPRQKDEYKVIVIGDSSVWGYLLNENETSSSIINAAGLSTCKGRPIHVYNLGYPGLLVLQDTLILKQALPYKPDLIIWNVTLLSMLGPKSIIKANGLIKNNVDLTQSLIDQYNLAPGLGPLMRASPPNQPFLDRREAIARFIKLQLDGIRWQATGGEPVGEGYEPLGTDVKDNALFERGNLRPPTLDPNLLLFNVLNAGIQMAGNTPVVIINEPIQVVSGANSDIRYDKMYPRWVYDQYRASMALEAKQVGWDYIDLWNILPPNQFSDSVFHRTAPGERVFTQAMKDIIAQHTSCP